MGKVSKMNKKLTFHISILPLPWVHKHIHLIIMSECNKHHRNIKFFSVEHSVIEPNECHRSNAHAATRDVFNEDVMTGGG